MNDDFFKVIPDPVEYPVLPPDMDNSLLIEDLK